MESSITEIKIYRYKRWTIMFMFLLFIIFLIFPFWNYVTYFHKLLLRFVGIPSTLWLTLYSYYVRLTISREGITFQSSFFVSQRQLVWDEIEEILDDCPFPRLRFSHRYNLIPKKTLSKKRWIVIPDCFEQYREILKKIVLRVSPETKVDFSILKLTGLTHQDIGKLYVLQEV